MIGVPPIKNLLCNEVPKDVQHPVDLIVRESIFHGVTPRWNQSRPRWEGDPGIWSTSFWRRTFSFLRSAIQIQVSLSRIRSPSDVSTVATVPSVSFFIPKANGFEVVCQGANPNYICMWGNDLQLGRSVVVWVVKNLTGQFLEKVVFLRIDNLQI